MKTTDQAADVAPPHVSVIVPVWNRAHLVHRSIGSLCAQSYKNLEIIVVDDASSDDIAGALDALGDSRIRLVRRMRNGGAAAARNDGIATARGTLIAFSDSDDICVFNRIERQVTLLDSAPDQIIAVYSSRSYYTEAAESEYGAMRGYVKPWAHEWPLSGELFAKTLRNNFITFPTLMVRRTALMSAGPCDALLRNNEDWDLMLRLTLEGRFAFIPDPLLFTPNTVIHESVAQRISLSARFSAQSFVRITGKLRHAGHHGPELAHHYRSAAGWLMREGRSHFARRFLRAALAIQPASLRNWRGYVLSHFPRLYDRLQKLRRRGV